MAKTIDIRDVPEDLHRRSKARATQMGMSLSDYLKVELTHLAERATMDEIQERIRSRPPVELKTPIEDIIREDRESH